MAKNLIKKKFYLIILTNLKFEILIMLDIKVIIKFNGITYQIKLKDRLKSKKKARLKNTI